MSFFYFGNCNGYFATWNPSSGNSVVILDCQMANLKQKLKLGQGYYQFHYHCHYHHHKIQKPIKISIKMTYNVPRYFRVFIRKQFILFHLLMHKPLNLNTKEIKSLIILQKWLFHWGTIYFIAYSTNSLISRQHKVCKNKYIVRSDMQKWIICSFKYQYISFSHPKVYILTFACMI